MLAEPSKEYAKDAKIRKEDVQMLQEWAEKQAHLPKISELQFILFLQSCYYSIEKAKTAIENYFTVRTLCKDIFHNDNPKDIAIQMALDVGMTSCLPKLAPNGDTVVFLKLLNPNPERYVYLDQVRMFDMMITLEMHQNGTKNGMMMVIDMEGSVFGHVLKLNPSVSKKYLFYLQEALPIRLKSIHIIHVPSWIDKLLAIFKPLMKKELFEMIHIHTSMDTFYKIVPQEVLPKDYGGSAEATTVLGEKNREWLEKNDEFFRNQAAQTTDESKRVEKSKDYDRIFGVEGSFKKLEVD